MRRRSPICENGGLSDEHRARLGFSPLRSGDIVRMRRIVLSVAPLITLSLLTTTPMSNAQSRNPACSAQVHYTLDKCVRACPGLINSAVDPNHKREFSACQKGCYKLHNAALANCH
jgi:hypothetical protein